MAARVFQLMDGWYWKERNPARPFALDEAFPSEIHVELMKAGRIADPFIGFNEHKVQWVGDREWLYYCTFPFDAGDKFERTELLFEGLDTICDVYLNFRKVLSADNMFRSYTVPVDIASLSAENNKLLLHFKSAKIVAKQLEQQYGPVRAGSTNLGDPSRVYVRKAQYHWRWDWGPELMTCGPYRPISVIAFAARVSVIHAHAIVSPTPSLSPSLVIDITVAGRPSAFASARFVLKDCANGAVLKEEQTSLKTAEDSGTGVQYKNLVVWELGESVQLWWPAGYGKQSLYIVEVILLGQDSTILDQQSQRIGFRRVELVQEPLQESDQHGQGTTFVFEVNGVRMFMGGSNWIPAHSFLTQVTPDRYRAWLTLLRDGNQNMVRLWGGGVYEPDIFYDTCDELGILVWQDFQFACGVYPAHSKFVENVKAEAEENVKRLRRHPALALFCGNNEDYQQVLQWGGITELPARILYEKILPDVVSELTDPPIPYHPGSPFGGQGWDTADPTVGDIHQWDVWGGKERPWQDYGSMGGRFVSEFGIPSMPDIRTVDYWLDGNKKERWAQSKLMSQHNKAGNHERRFAIVMNENFRLTSDLETHIYNTQLMQSEAVSFAYRMWRREWRGKERNSYALDPPLFFNFIHSLRFQTSGALVWQLNDCWPVTSWAIVDYFLRAKPAYYTIARELAPITVGITRQVTKNRDNDRPKQFYEFGAFRSVDASIQVWATSRLLEPRAVDLILHCADLQSEWKNEQSFEAVLLPNQSTELLSISCPCPAFAASDEPPTTTSYSVVVGARLVDRTTGQVLARYADWPQPYRFLEIPDPGLRVHVDGERITVEVEKPVKGLIFRVDGDESDGEVRWSDNALDVMPGDPQNVMASGIGGRRIRMAYFGKEQATLL